MLCGSITWRRGGNGRRGVNRWRSRVRGGCGRVSPGGGLRSGAAGGLGLVFETVSYFLQILAKTAGGAAGVDKGGEGKCGDQERNGVLHDEKE